MQLSGSDRATVFRATLLLAATWFALRIAGFRRWKNFLDRRLPANSSPAPSDSVALPEAQRLARLHSAAARHLFLGTNCLEQATSLYFLLRRRGLPAELHFAAQRRPRPASPLFTV